MLNKRICFKYYDFNQKNLNNELYNTIGNWSANGCNFRIRRLRDNSGYIFEVKYLNYLEVKLQLWCVKYKKVELKCNDALKFSSKLSNFLIDFSLKNNYILHSTSFLMIFTFIMLSFMITEWESKEISTFKSHWCFFKNIFNRAIDVLGSVIESLRLFFAINLAFKRLNFTLFFSNWECQKTKSQHMFYIFFLPLLVIWRIWLLVA